MPYIKKIHIFIFIYKIHELIKYRIHVEEDLKTGIEALIVDLRPELVQFVLTDLLHRTPPSPPQRIEQLQRKLHGISHPCKTCTSFFFLLRLANDTESENRRTWLGNYWASCRSYSSDIDLGQ